MLNLQLFVIPTWFHVAWMATLSLTSFWRGGWREQVIAASHVIQLATTVAICVLGPCWLNGLPNPLWRNVASDAAMLAICLACAWRTERYFVLWASSFALLCVATDLLGLFVPGVTVWAYASANIVWSYLLDICVVCSALSGPRIKTAREGGAFLIHRRRERP